MPKPKQFLSVKKKSKHAATAPQTADEYLAAGVDFEEAGEKWRGGDSAKSTRFFVRAIDCYDEALRKFPGSFDLAYNKARVQYELTQHPKLLKELPMSLLDLLQTALESSRLALGLNGENADALFNTAQILVSLTEKLAESPSGPAPLHLIEEALRLFQKCLEVQEKQAKDAAAQSQEAQSMFDTEYNPGDVSDTEEGGVAIAQDTSMDIDGGEPAQDERWASIIEPVTNSVLLDTILAQLETLTTMCGLIVGVDERAIGSIEQYAKDLIEVKLPAYTPGTNRGLEAAIYRATFTSAHSCLKFQASLLDGKSYLSSIKTAYAFPLDTSAEGLCRFAEALVTFNTTVRLSLHDAKALQLRWAALSEALKYFTAASQIYGADNIVKIHIARGDCEVGRFQLGESGFKAAFDNREVLLRNAGKFYAGAKALAPTHAHENEEFEAMLKGYLTQALLGDPKAFQNALEEFCNTQPLLAEMLDEGLVSESQLASLGISSG
ncbi:hypothetical protein LZ554_000228 [Drepanopeziza brunnea f. sp. 'monogermtubi']|nr:hypothetical protein LZ554_000228 [Drepanopeziza brunnea f. sp. 'monogermtubi']